MPEYIEIFYSIKHCRWGVFVYHKHDDFDPCIERIALTESKIKQLWRIVGKRYTLISTSPYNILEWRFRLTRSL